MELKFLGRGAAFNPIERNTSAYFIEDDKLFLLDSGETVFASLMNNNILESIIDIKVINPTRGPKKKLVDMAYENAKIR